MEYFKEAALYTRSPTWIVTRRKKRSHYQLHGRRLKETKTRISERKNKEKGLKSFQELQWPCKWTAYFALYKFPWVNFVCKNPCLSKRISSFSFSVVLIFSWVNFVSENPSSSNCFIFFLFCYLAPMIFFNIVSPAYGKIVALC